MSAVKKHHAHSAPSSVRPSSGSATSTASITTPSAWVTPGQIVGSTKDLAAGTGCYVLHGTTDIYAGVVGVKKVTKSDAGGKPFVQVESLKPPTRLPAVGDVVTCRVTKINARMASVEILVLHPTIATVQEASATPAVASGATILATPAESAQPYILDESLAGTIRQRDIRAFEVDSVEVYKSFRPSDLVKAQVLSLGDARSYFLSTARNDLGVILATATSGSTMVPINWEQMQCPVTGVKEYRKVAKID